jgi:acyl-CoA hydrolase
MIFMRGVNDLSGTIGLSDFSNYPIARGLLKMNIKTYVTNHLVKSEDLNHHGTLYAGRTAEWFVESGFIAAASLTRPENIVCLKIHGMLFSRPVRRGEIICFESRIVCSGHSRLIAYIESKVSEQVAIDGFITFVHVDAEGRTLPHGIVIEPSTPAEFELYEKAKNLPV